MNKSEVLWKNWKEMIYDMEMEIHAQAELINVQREQIRSLEGQIELLEEQKKKPIPRVPHGLLIFTSLALFLPAISHVLKSVCSGNCSVTDKN